MQTRTFAVYVAASANQVWQALTDPRLTRGFYFGLAVESDWQAGSAITYQGPGPARLVGEIVHVEPGRRLVHSLLPSVDVPEGAESWVTWELSSSEPGVCRVSLTHDDFEPSGDPEQDEAWLRLVSNLKTLIETGAALVKRPQ